MNVDRSKFDWPFYADDTGKPKKILYAACNAGLCNRLMVLLSCARIARLTGRNFKMYWPVDAFKKDEGLGCSFSALFNNRFQFMGTDDVYWTLDSHHTTSVLEPPGKIDVMSESQADVVVVKGWYWTHLDGVIPNFDLRTELLNTLEPRAIVQYRLAEVHTPERAFGVHVRQNHPTFSGSTLDKFKTAIDSHLKAHDRFVVVSDNAHAKAELQRHYGSRCHTLGDIGGRESTENRSTELGMHDALVDLYTLSRFSTIVGTQHSTFSECAAFLGERSHLDWV